MYQDANLTFDPSGTAITASAVSTNVLDLGANRDLGVGTFRGKLLVQVGTTFTASAQTATLNIQVQGAPDNGSGSPGTYSTLDESGVTPIGLLVAGARASQFDIASVFDSSVPTQAAGTTATWSNGASSITVSNGAGIQAGQYVQAAAGIVPGTTVASSYTLGSTTVPISTNTTAAQSTAVAVSFTVAVPAPRFLRINYVVANGPFTAGTVTAAIFGDPIDEPMAYRPGFTQPY
jgi:hypothetical protein